MSELQNNSAQLRAAIDAANARAYSAEQRAANAESRLNVERGSRVVAEETAVDNAIVAAEDRANALQAQWVSLQEAGDIAGAGKIMRQMSEETAKVDRFRAQKEWLAGQRQVREQNAAAPADPMAQYTIQERAWIERNPEFLSNQTVNARVTSEHFKALADGIVKDSDEYYQRLTRAAHPERFAEGGTTSAGDPQPKPVQQTQTADSGDTDAPFSGADDDAPSVVVGGAPQQQHTRNADPVSQTVDIPEMRIAADPNQSIDGGDDQQPSQPKVRAVGRGNPGLSGVAAPSRSMVNQAAGRAARGNIISATPEEVATAITLAESIEPELAARGDHEEIVRWYYALAHSPTHLSARRRAWAREAIVG